MARSSGIAEAFNNPVQHIREDFGSTRFDQVFSDRDTLAVSYTIDDSHGFSPSNNPFTFVDISLQEQVTSLNETHIFSPAVVNKATFGFSRGYFYFNSDTTVNLPSWIHPGQPVGALVVGGGTTLNGASQITNGGTNAGSNLTAARNLFTISDQVTVTKGKHLMNAGVWLQPTQANDTLIQDQYGQASFTNLQTFLQGTVSTYTFAPGAVTPLDWHTFEGAFYAEDSIKLRPSLELRIGFRGEFTNGWNEAHGRASNYGFGSNGVIRQHSHHWFVGFYVQQRYVFARAAHRTGLVALRLKDHCNSRQFWHLLRTVRQSELPSGPERTIQPSGCSEEHSFREHSARKHLSRHKSDSERCRSQPENTYG